VCIKPHFSALKMIAPVNSCIRFEQFAADQSEGRSAKPLQEFGFSFAPWLARFVQETDRSVSYSQGEK
jgi:hypothetical protein